MENSVSWEVSAEGKGQDWACTLNFCHSQSDTGIIFKKQQTWGHRKRELSLCEDDTIIKGNLHTYQSLQSSGKFLVCKCVSGIQEEGSGKSLVPYHCIVSCCSVTRSHVRYLWPMNYWHTGFLCILHHLPEFT